MNRERVEHAIEVLNNSSLECICVLEPGDVGIILQVLHGVLNECGPCPTAPPVAPMQNSCEDAPKSKPAKSSGVDSFFSKIHKANGDGNIVDKAYEDPER